MSEALAALYAGDAGRARELLPPDEDLSVFEAAAFGRVERLRAILQERPAEAQGFSADGFTALHLAVFGLQEDAARVLIEHGAELDAVSRASFAQVTPLGTAAFVRSVPMARLLLDAGADPDANDRAARATAAANGDEELIRLLDAGAQ
ncbi:MAG: ankyrin repeat domain-containing protein [Thermoleophilia bacterium]|nr:ankyrin repeat domain-containing protein [Thermoleophilia bacterium]